MSYYIETYGCLIARIIKRFVIEYIYVKLSNNQF